MNRTTFDACLEKNAEVRRIDEPEDDTFSCLAWSVLLFVALLLLSELVDVYIFWCKGVS